MTKIKFRFHRGSLEESMKTYKEFNSVSEMFEHIESEWSDTLTTDDLVIGDSLGKDDRIGWKSYRYVGTKRIGNTVYSCPQCIGMCDLGEEGEEE